VKASGRKGVAGTRMPGRRPGGWHLSLFLPGCLLACLCLAGVVHAQAPAAAQQRGNRPVSETIADRPSELYRFERHHIDSSDGQRRYRIEVAIPQAPAPAAGHAALYMLDGNAAMDTLTDGDLALLSSRNPPVLVAIGYDVSTRNDVVSRAYDYTPPVTENGHPVAQPVVRGRAGGGADIFLELIHSQIKPLVSRRASVDPAREYLWGHSYGGLFVLHTLFTRPEAFSRYIVGDPSAWWYNGALIKEWLAFDANRAAGKRVAILVGTRPREPNRPAPGATPVQADGTAIDLRAAVREMAEGLRKGGADTDYQEFPQYGHGEMIRASLERALQIATEP